MKKLPWILIVLLLIACVAAWFRPHEQSPAEVRVETNQGRYDAYLCTYGCVLAFRAG